MKKIIIFILLANSIYANSLSEENIRYFGGYSENEVNLVKSKVYTAPLVVTEKVFNAKKSADIDKVVEEQQLKDISNMISAEEFLEDKSGHLFGGYSEKKLILQSIK